MANSLSSPPKSHCTAHKNKSTNLTCQLILKIIIKHVTLFLTKKCATCSTFINRGSTRKIKNQKILMPVTTSNLRGVTRFGSRKTVVFPIVVGVVK
jgi:hypothetical protein